MVASGVKKAVREALTRTPYRMHNTLPSMLPAAPPIVHAIDRLRYRRATPRPLRSLEDDLPPAEIERHVPCR